MRSLLYDLRYALRQLRRSPGFTSIAILTLALGVSVNTATFSIVNGFLFSSLHIRQESRLVALGFREKGTAWGPTFSLPEYRDLRSDIKSVFSGIVAFQYGIDGVSTAGRKPDRSFTDYVTGNYFQTLGIKPFLGRLFQPSEGEVPGADPEMVLSYTYWKQHFGGDPNVVGRRILVDGHPITIIGIVPGNFRGLNPTFGIQGYLPLAMMVTIENIPLDQFNERTFRNLRLYARLQPSVTEQQANAAMALVGRRFGVEHPRTEKDPMTRAFPLYMARGGGIDPDNIIAFVCLLFLGLAGVVLLLACVNVANLLLVRASVREREMVIRSALGAQRSRLIRQMLTESILLALVGGAAGVGLGLWGSSFLASVNPHMALPISLNFGFDSHVFAFSAAIALLAGALVGLVPALRLSRANLNLVLRESGRGVVSGGSKFRTGLVMLQVGCALVLLVIAGLFTRSLSQVAHASPGFNPSHVLTLTMDTSEIGFNPSQERDFYTNLLQRVRVLPGVDLATIADTTPFNPTQQFPSSDIVAVPGYQTPPGQPAPKAEYVVVAPDYSHTLQIPLLQGRGFSDRDNEAGQHVAIVSEAMAKKFWPHQDPIGKQFTMGSDPTHALQVVGMVGDARYQSIVGAFPPMFYVPFQQHFTRNSQETLALRTTGQAAAMIPEVERTIHNMASTLPVFGVETLREALYSLNGLFIFQVAAAVAATLGTLGLVLAVVGIYGVLSYVVSQRTNEIGIRMAMGAQRSDVLRMIYRQGLRIIGVGLALGIVASFLAAHVMRSLIVVSATDPLTYVGVSAILLAVALLACYIPAQRAMNVDPMQALREE
jgi:macrolide transport system ATP-binding/permease protein